MAICRLCLMPTDGTGICSSICEALEIFLPEMSHSLVEQPEICEKCLHDLSTAYTFFRSKIESDIRIQEQLNRFKISKVDLKSVRENEGLTVTSDVCRICLKLINNNYRIFLQESIQQNVLADILEICNISLNLEISDNPTMCSNCWKLLQKMFQFKNKFINVEMKIREYYKLSNSNTPLRQADLEKIVTKENKLLHKGNGIGNKINVDVLVNGYPESDVILFYNDHPSDVDDSFEEGDE